MSCYWAEWNPISSSSKIIRNDTRVYYHSGSHSQNDGHCIGSFCLENPGSGLSSHGPASSGWSPVVDIHGHPGDPTLQMIWNVWDCAQSLGRYTAQPDDYIEVLNLYYLRNANSGSALATWMATFHPSFSYPSIRPRSQFVVPGWGMSLNSHPLAISALATIRTHVNSFPKTKFPVPLLLALRPYTHIIVYPMTLASIVSPLVPYPLHPMGAANRGLKLLYIANVAASI